MLSFLGCGRCNGPPGSDVTEDGSGGLCNAVHEQRQQLLVSRQWRNQTRPTHLYETFHWCCELTEYLVIFSILFSYLYVYTLKE